MHPKIPISPFMPMSPRLLYIIWLGIWILSILLVITGSLLPASSPVIRAVGRLPVSLKVLHFCGYTWLALLAFLTIKRRSLAVTAALAMILLGVALEFGLPGIAIGMSRRILPAVSNS